MSQTAILTDEQMPLDVGSLVSLSINICEPLPALVVGRGRAHVRAADGGPPACKVGDRAVIGWSIGGELHELRTRVVRAVRPRVRAHGLAPRDHHAHRRPPRRRALRARGRRQPAAGRRREILGFTHDLSIHGVGLLLEGDDPGARHARRARGAGRPRACCCRARPCAWCTRARRGRRAWRASASRFDDPERVAGATGRLLSLLA